MSTDEAKPLPTPTHADLVRAYPTGGILPPDCDGPTTLELEVRERELLAGDGEMRTVCVFHCEKCHTHVSVDATAGKIINTYKLVAADEMAAALARTFTLPADKGGAK